MRNCCRHLQFSLLYGHIGQFLTTSEVKDHGNALNWHSANRVDHAKFNWVQMPLSEV